MKREAWIWKMCVNSVLRVLLTLCMVYKYALYFHFALLIFCTVLLSSNAEISELENCDHWYGVLPLINYISPLILLIWHACGFCVVFF